MITGLEVTKIGLYVSSLIKIPGSRLGITFTRYEIAEQRKF